MSPSRRFALVATGLVEQVSPSLCFWSDCHNNCTGNGECISGVCQVTLDPKP